MSKDKKYNIQNLNPQQPKWNNAPTKAVRIPEMFIPQCLNVARLLDAGGKFEKSREENNISASQTGVSQFLE